MFPTIIFPVFPEIVAVFSDGEVRRPSRGLSGALREIYESKEFLLASCAETMEEIETPYLRSLRLVTQIEVAIGSYNFLYLPLALFSRTIAEHDFFMR